MNRAIPMLIIGLLFGGLAGFLLAASYGITLDGHDHASDHGVEAHETRGHAHTEVLQLSDENAPLVTATLHADPMGGWNLEVATENFRFAPEHVSTSHVNGEGHAHVYINGQKISRLYGNWMQLPAVNSGDVVAVILSSNDHKTLALDGKSISASLSVPTQ